jgi:negative regulator of flagellin synthesis FlgM
MEITGKPISDAIDTYTPTTTVTTGAADRRRQPAGENSADKVVLSPRAREIQDARQRAESLPDVRKDKVHRIRRQLAAGTYSVNGDEIAFKMMKESVFNQMA